MPDPAPNTVRSGHSTRPTPSPTPGAPLRYLLVALAAAAVILVDPIASLLVPASQPDPASVATPEIQILARFGMAIRAIQAASPDAASADLTSSLTASLDDARTPIEELPDRESRLIEAVAQIRSAIAIAELDGADAALSRLAALDGFAATLDADVEAESAIVADLAQVRRIYTDGSGALDGADRDRLIARHGLMGRVALAWDAPDTDPDRRALVAASMRAVIAIGVVLVLAVLGVVVGMVLFSIAIVMRSTGRLPMRYQPDRASDARVHNAFLETVILFLGAFAVYKALAVVVSLTVPTVGPVLQGVDFVVLWALALLSFWPMVRGVDRATVFRSMGWMRGRGIAREILAGVAAYLAFLPVVIVGFIAMIVLMRVFGLTPTHPIVDQFSQSSPWGIAMLYLLAAVWAPVVEESIFRGALFHHARRFVGFLLSALVAAFLFAAIHPQGIAGIPPLMALALGFAACREWRGSLIGSITAHALHNTVIVTFGIFALG